MNLLLSRLPRRFGLYAWLISAPLLWESPGSLVAKEDLVRDDLYTVNFQNLGIQDFIRFVGRATRQNFVFEEDQAPDFTITMVADEPTDAQSLMTALVQVLRANGFLIAQQGSNILIYRSPDVAQLARVVTDNDQIDAEDTALVTRVFRLHAVTPEGVMPILQSMVSTSARLEPSPQTQQIIVTDVSTNVAKIGQLLQALDAPNAGLTIETYKSEGGLDPQGLALARAVLQPLAEQNTLVIEAQPNSDNIFIVSTPFLADQTKDILKAIDLGHGSTADQIPFLYNAQSQSAQALLDRLNEIATHLEQSGVTRSGVVQAIHSAQLIPTSNGILFSVDTLTQGRLQELLKQLDDNQEKAGSNTLLFQPKNHSSSQFLDLAHKLGDDLATRPGHQEEAEVLKQATQIGQQGILLNGPTQVLEGLQQILDKLDSLPAIGEGELARVFPIQQSSPAQVKVGLEQISADLGAKTPDGEAFARAVSAAQVISGNTALLITASPAILKQVAAYIAQLDVAGSKGSMVVLENPNMSAEQLKEQLLSIADSTLGADGANAKVLLGSATVLPGGRGLLVSGDEATVDHLKELTSNIEGHFDDQQPRIFKLSQARPAQVLAELSTVASSLNPDVADNASLMEAIKSAKAMVSGNAILASGSKQTLDRMASLITSLDAPAAAEETAVIPVLHGTADELQKQLLALADGLPTAQQAEIKAILEGGQWLPGNHSIVLVGPKDAIDIIKQLYNAVDGQSLHGEGAQTQIFAITNTSAGQVQQGLNDIAEMMSQEGPSGQDLLKAIKSIKLLPSSNSLLITGSAGTMERIKSYIASLDISTPTVGTYALPLDRADYEDVKKQLEQLALGLSLDNDAALMTSLRSAQWSVGTRSLVFAGSADTLKQVDELAKQLGSAGDVIHTWVYHPQNVSAPVLQQSIAAIAQQMRAESSPDLALIAALESAKPIGSSGSLSFSVPKNLQESLSSMVQSLDVKAGGESSSSYFIAPVAQGKADEVKQQVEALAEQLSKSGLSNPALIAALRSATAVKDGSGLAFSGDAATLQQVEALIQQIPGSASGAVVLNYTPKHLSPQQLLAALRNTAETLRSQGANPDLLRAIDSASLIAASNSIIFRVTPAAETTLQNMLDSLDSGQGALQTVIYQAKNVPAEALAKSLKETADSLSSTSQGDALSKSIGSTEVFGNTLIIQVPSVSVPLIQQLLAELDNEEATQGRLQLYTAQNQPASALKENLKAFFAQAEFDDPVYSSLKRAADGITVLPGDQALALTGSGDQKRQLEQILKQLDRPQSQLSRSFIFPVPSQVNPQDALRAIDQLAEATTGDRALQSVLKSRRYVQQSNAIVFTGPADILQAELPSALQSLNIVGLGEVSTINFRPNHLSSAQMMSAIQDTATTLESEGGNYSLVRGLRSARLVDASGTILIQVSSKDVPAMQQLLEGLDDSQGSRNVKVYALPPGVSMATFLRALDGLAAQAGASNNMQLEEAIQSHKQLGDQTLSFSGTPQALDQLSQLLGQINLPSRGAMETITYQAQHTTADILVSALHKTAESFSRMPGSAGLAEALASAEAIGSTQNIVLHAPADDVSTVRQLLNDLDSETAGGTQVYIYALRVAPINQMKLSLDEVASELSQANNPVDKGVALAIESGRYIPSSNSLMFTGSDAAISRLKALVPNFDRPTDAHPSKPQLFVYRSHGVPISHIELALKTLEKSLSPSDAGDAALISAIENMQELPDKQSILFTADAQTLARLQSALSRIDPSVGTTQQLPGDSNFLIYRLQSASAARVQEALRALALSLQRSGLDDPNFFRTITDMQVDPSGNALIFAGDPQTLSQLEPLIATYDVAPQHSGSEGQAVIEPVSNTSFMIYKLRYMQGNEIENTLRQMGNDLIKVKSTINQQLVHAISTMQWIQSSNSLCFSGEPDTLQKLQSLVSNIDQPVRQVFIEVLVIRTSLANTYNFTLDWVSLGQISPNFAIGVGNPQPLAPGQSQNTLFGKTAQTASAQPSLVIPGGQQGLANSVLNNNQFSLGAIGNVVRNGGKTFFDLGSLVQALQTDTNSTVVINPKIIAQDSSTATISSGQVLGFVTQQTQVFSQQTSNATTVDYRQVGVQLTITPIIAGDVVTLEIDQLFTEVTPGFNPQAGAGGLLDGSGTFPTNVLHCTTRAHVPDQAILCISGLTNHTTQNVTQQIPCLGGLPLIGALFSNNANSKNDEQTMIFIKPYILSSLEEMRAITQANARILKDDSGCTNAEHVQRAFDTLSYDTIPESDSPCLGH